MWLNIRNLNDQSLPNGRIVCTVILQFMFIIQTKCW